MSTLTYAAYGSNLHPARLEARVPSAKFLGTGYIDDCALTFDKKGKDGSGKCSITAGGRGVHLAIYRLDAEDKAVLDVIEHAGIGYEVVAVQVPGYGPCFTYRARAPHIVAGLAPYCWYHEMVMKGCRVHCFPSEYLESVAEVIPIRDPVEDRRERNWRAIRRMSDTL